MKSRSIWRCPSRRDSASRSSIISTMSSSSSRSASCDERLPPPSRSAFSFSSSACSLAFELEMPRRLRVDIAAVRGVPWGAATLLCSARKSRRVLRAKHSVRTPKGCLRFLNNSVINKALWLQPCAQARFENEIVRGS